MQQAAASAGQALQALVLTLPSLRIAAPQRGALQVVAAQAGKPAAAKVAKKMDSAVKRAMIAEERRMYNKARKSACATRIKKVCMTLVSPLRAGVAALVLN